MGKYFKSRLIYFHKPGVKIKPESEISCHNTQTSVISGYSTLDIFTTVVSTRRKGNWQPKVGCRGYPHPQLIF